MKAGGAYIEVRADSSHLKGDLSDAHQKIERSATKMQNSMTQAFKVIATAGIAAGVAIAYGMKKAIDAASDLQEVQGKFDVVFAKHSKQAEDMAKILVDSYAMSTREAKEYMSSVQDLLVPMGMASEKAVLMSNEVVKLSADLGSFNNLPTAQVMADIQSALVGNFETMKKYGVVLNETVIKQEALSRGLWDGKGMVDANTKAQIAYALMLKGSEAAVGDLERTSASYANQMKQLEANIENISATIGKELLPEASKLLAEINEWIKSNKELLGQNIEIYISGIKSMLEVAIKPLRTWTDLWRTLGWLSAGGQGSMFERQKQILIEQAELFTRLAAAENNYTGAYREKYIANIKRSLAGLENERKKLLEIGKQTDENIELFAGFNETVEKIPLLKLEDFKNKLTGIELELQKAEEAADAFLKDPGAGTWEIMQQQFEELPGIQEETLTEMTAQQEHFFENIHDISATFTKDLVRGHLDSWKDGLKSLKDLFLDTLGEMMALALANPIKVTISGAAGAVGLGGLTGGSGGSGGGSGFSGIPGLGSLADLFPGLSSFLGSSVFASGSIGAMTSAGGFSMAGMSSLTWGGLLGGVGLAALAIPMIAGLFGGKPHKPHIGIDAGVEWGGGGFAGVPGYGEEPGGEWYSGTGEQYVWGLLRGSGNIGEALEAFDSAIKDSIDAYISQINSLIDSSGLGDEDLGALLNDISLEFATGYHGNNIEKFIENVLNDLEGAFADHAGEVVHALAPTFIGNIDMASISGIASEDSPIYEFYRRLQELAAVETLDADQLAEFLEKLEGITKGIETLTTVWNDMDYAMQIAAGTISEYRQGLDAINKQYDSYYAAAEALSMSEERLVEIRAYQAKAVEELNRMTRENLGKEARDIIAAHQPDDPRADAQAWLMEQLAAWGKMAAEMGWSAEESIRHTNDIYEAFEFMLADIADAAASEAEDIAKNTDKVRQARIDTARGNLIEAIEKEISGYEQAQAAMEQTFAAAKNAYVNALREEIAVKNEAVRAAESTVDIYDSLLTSISDYRSDLATGSSSLSPDVRYRQSELELEQAVQGLYSGDAETIQKSLGDIPGLSEKYLAASEDANADFRLYRADFARVMTILNTSEDIGQVHKTVAEQTLEAALIEAEALEEMLYQVEGASDEIKSLADLQREYNDAKLELDNSVYPDLIAADLAKINLLRGINDNTKTVADALKDLEDAQDPMKQAQELLDTYNETYSTNASLGDVGAYAHQLATGEDTATEDINRAVLEIVKLLHPEMSDQELSEYYKTYSFAGGGTVSGPMSGYSMPVTFHGKEHIVTDDQLGSVVAELKDVKKVLKLILNTSGDINKYTQKAQATLKKWERDEGSLYITAAA